MPLILLGPSAKPDPIYLFETKSSEMKICWNNLYYRCYTAFTNFEINLKGCGWPAEGHQFSRQPRRVCCDPKMQQRTGEDHWAVPQSSHKVGNLAVKRQL